MSTTFDAGLSKAEFDSGESLSRGDSANWAIAQGRVRTLVGSIVCGLMTALIWLPPQVQIELTPDSIEYEEIARNLAQGRGFTSFFGRIADNRSPVYPAALAFLFDEQPNVWHNRVVWFHRILAFLIGSIIILLSSELFGATGFTCGILTSILVAANNELRYSARQVLTELPATALLLLSLLSIHWSVNGKPLREFLAALLQIALFMTRSAIVFCGIGYGFYLLYNACRQPSRDRVLRVVWFGGPCLLAIVSWSAFLWMTSGNIILLTTTGLSNLAAGLSPQFVAVTQGWPIPRTDKELEDFWTMAPPLSCEQVRAAVSSAISQPLTAIALTASKFKIAFGRIPIGAYFLGMIGFAIQCVFHLEESLDSNRLQNSLRRWASQLAYVVSFGSVTLAICGLSHPLTRAAIIAASVTIVVCGYSPKGNLFSPRTAGMSIPPILFALCFGFVVMTLMSFGLPRFTRPFLPMLYLSATLCIPLAFRKVHSQGFGGACLSLPKTRSDLL